MTSYYGKNRKVPHEASRSLFYSSHIMMSYCVSITEQTTSKSYLFVLYNKKKNPELNIAYFLSTQTFEKVEILQISRVYMIYTNIKGMLLDKVLCDVIPCVCPLIDHGSRPMNALEFLALLYK
jgi:hypothetical protein